MKKKKIITTLLSLTLLSIIVLLIGFDKLFDWSRPDNDFRVPSETEIVRIVLSEQGLEPVIIERQKDGSWTLNEYSSVNEISLRDLLETLNRLTTRQPASRAIKDEENLFINTSGIKVTVFEKKPLINIFNLVRLIPVRRTAKSFVVGNDSANNDGAFMRMRGAANPYLVHIPGSEISLRNFFRTDFIYWLDPVVVDLKSDEIRRISVQNNLEDDELFSLENLNDRWLFKVNQEVVSNEKISGLSLQRFLGSFEELYYERLLVGEDSIKHRGKMIEPKFMRLLVESNDGVTTSLEFFRKEKDDKSPDPDSFFLIVNGEKLSLARYFVFNRIIKSSSHFLR